MVKALRGAAVAKENSKQAIISTTKELLNEMIDKNGLAPKNIISIIFTATKDLTKEFPAVAAREIGLNTVPLLCCRELAVEGALEKCIRIMMHVYMDAEPNHIYLGKAKKLRDDIVTE